MAGSYCGLLVTVQFYKTAAWSPAGQDTVHGGGNPAPPNVRVLNSGMCSS